ncbi:MAG: peptidoglycan DD-metalloendopeptidase family protein [Acidimicrobiia bacterium]|nr:peptidoglycan DD-metalloendopeptidase family protein [Actinomycetota bacterium]MBL6923921.1 peptidoglycan DD-metalloendopeptidase family protein [Acidimicrobiia bacterium]MBL6927509.1 peptidoglycan DD-metalloendopeptidase family protein [Acidimicrobiia bacterium]
MPPTPKTRIRALTAMVVLVAVMAPTGASGETESIRDARDRREAARDRAADAAEVLELIEAEDAEIAGALGALDDAVALQQAKIASARQAIEAAEAEATLRWVEVEQVGVEIREVRARVEKLAVDVYISGLRPGILLESNDLSAGIRKSAILDVVTGNRSDLLERLRSLESTMENIAQAADAAIFDAELQQRELESSMLVLDRRISSQEEVQTELQGRIQEHEQAVKQFEREQYQMAVLIDNLIAEELRKSAPDLTKESGAGFIMPIEGKIGSGFGLRVHPIFGTSRQHNGVDISCVRNQPIWAAKAGEVIFAGWKNGYGNVVLMEHEGPVVTVYAHQEELLVSKGHILKTGDVLGRCGSTGWSTGPHLHFEVRTGGEPKDPMIVLPR